MPKRRNQNLSLREAVEGKRARTATSQDHGSQSQEPGSQDHRPEDKGTEINLLDSRQVQCSGSFISAHVSLSTKQKIWSNEYIEFKTLLKQSPEDQKQKIQFVNGEFLLTPKDNVTRMSESIEPWSNAFIIFMSIYVEKYPDETHNLLQNFHNIRLAAVKFSGWSNYDRQFRLKKSVSTGISWQSIDPELWMLSMQPLVGNSHLSVGKPCFAFNHRGFCLENSCKYTHICLKCQGQHPSIYCFHIYKGGETGPRFQPPYSKKGLNMTDKQQSHPSAAMRFRSPSNVSRSSAGQSTANRYMGPWKNTY